MGGRPGDTLPRAGSTEDGSRHRARSPSGAVRWPPRTVALGGARPPGPSGPRVPLALEGLTPCGLGADVGLEAMALLVRLGPDPVEGRPDHVRVVFDLRFRGIRYRDFRVLIGRRRRSGRPRPPPFPSDERAVDLPSHHLLEDDLRPSRHGPRLRPEKSTARVAVRRV